jgi:hypothetical protein
MFLRDFHQGRLDDPTIGSLPDKVADGKKHLIGVGHVNPMVKQSL